MSTKASVGNTRLYSTLRNVLDAIRSEAPKSLSVYHPNPGNADAVMQARSRAFLHLFLKAKFGLVKFEDREKLVTDGPLDGGVDAYFIDNEQRLIYVLQSKFRGNASNFTSSNVSAADLLKVDLKRILKGERDSGSGQPYNPQIRKMQAAIKKLPSIAQYDYRVVLVGNAQHLSAADVRKLVDGYEVEQYDYLRAYKELLFPVISGSYFTSPRMTIEIKLENLRSGDTHLDYNVKTAELKANIKVLFVPTIEIGRIMSTHKNSILKFNPRSYLELKNNKVNKDIESSISTDAGNEFALFNNGITIICDNTVISSNTARQGSAQVEITSPQLVNGGQTAYTLGRHYERAAKTADYKDFKGKEVLLKIISFVPNARGGVPAVPKLQLISDISKASNSQTPVKEADRRSNDPVQVTIQEKFFEDYGLYYERKKGEFSDGLHYGYIEKSDVIDRDRLLRVSLAAQYRPSQAKAGLGKFYKETALSNQLRVTDVAKYAYGLEMLRLLDLKKRQKMKGDRWKKSLYGFALQYGDYAVVAICIDKGMKSSKKPADVLDAVLSSWLAFETKVAKKKANAKYVKNGGFDAISYYKGATVGDDLKEHAFKI